MWPWGHLAVGYLAYVAALHVRGRGEQTLWTLVAVAFGTQFPDLIDKPLAWSLTVLPSGRSLAHSLITATVVIWLAYLIAERVDSTEVAVAFGIGYVSHSLADLGPEVVIGLLQGDLGQLKWTTYLLWPVLPSPPYPQDHSFMEHFAALALEPYVTAQFVLFGIAIAVWIRSGTPGLTTVRRNFRSVIDRDV
ncbi:metal-dependent hydrolase [Halobacteriales archaeon QS_1_67_19]|nr:MAG: metal-dependent hydrolase [Halobacteriales archaeon QS_1_67_19]